MLDAIVIGAIVGGVVGGLFAVLVPKAPCPTCGKKIAKNARKCPGCKTELEKGWAGE